MPLFSTSTYISPYRIYPSLSEYAPIFNIYKRPSRAVGWGGALGAFAPPPSPLGHRRSVRSTSRPRSAHRLVKSRILSGCSPLFSPNSLKSPLNWLKCTQKIWGASSQNPVRPPLSSHPGSATDTATPRGRHCHSLNTLNTLSTQGWYRPYICAFSSMHTYSGRREGLDSVRITL